MKARATAAAIALAMLCARPSGAQTTPSLSDTDEGMRHSAVLRIQLENDPARATDLILALSREPSSAVREEIVKTLSGGKFRGERSYKAVARVLTHDLSDTVRKEAAAAVLSYDGPGPLSLLEDFLKEEAGEAVRRSVCVALSTPSAHAGDPEATSLLTARLAEDGSPLVRLAAVAALAARADRRALENLKTASTRDSDKDVRRAAAKAYKALMPPPEVAKRKERRLSPARQGLIKGRDRCPPGNGWCQCGDGRAINIPAQCRPREDCETDFENTYRRYGWTCDFDGQRLY